MVARMLLPMLGGAPAVWITCLLFFQAALLVAYAYAYAHASARWLGVRVRAFVHLVVLAAPLLVLPIHFAPALARAAQAGHAPTAWLLAMLVVGAGLPFFVVSTSAPLLQDWFSRGGHPSAKDPYFLYAASNLGSMVGLAAYPAIVEPLLGLSAQARLWSWGYVLLTLLVASCAAVAFRARRVEPPYGPGEAPSLSTAYALPVARLRRARWVALASVPSSLLLGVTSYVTTDIAPIPLFWVLPLALYLLSFICVFAGKPPIPHALMVRFFPLAATMAAISIALELGSPGWLLVLIHSATLFLGAMVCHGELARDRPDPRQLTEYYLWISVGGVLGGVFNAIVAPALFSRIVEYPLAIVLACWCRPALGTTGDGGGDDRGGHEERATVQGDRLRARALDLAVPVASGALGVLLILGYRALALDPASLASRFVVATPFLVTYGSLPRPRRFALSLAAGLAASTLFTGVYGRTLTAVRNFYGVVRVTHDDGGRFVQMVHGNTVHGRQYLDPARRMTPVVYYDRSGPLGAAFDAFDARALGGARVAVIGLGSGVMAAYARGDEDWTFYEINPAVMRLALDPAYFTFLSDQFPGGRHLTLVEGDARLRLREAKAGSFDLLVLDAFSSDAIPAHLLTREAVALYLDVLAARGLLVAHISNRYLDLAPVFGNLARDAGLVAVTWADVDLSADDLERGKVGSQWVVMARRREELGALASDGRWHAVPTTAAPGWTDDFSNLLLAYRW